VTVAERGLRAGDEGLAKGGDQAGEAEAAAGLFGGEDEHRGGIRLAFRFDRYHNKRCKEGPMSDTVDLRLLGKMVSRLQSTVEDVRQEYASLRASVDAMHTTVHTRFQEFNVRMSSLELAQMKLAANVDNAHSKIDRLEVELETVREEMNSKLDAILARLGER
jgi:hypothetical protein